MWLVGSVHVGGGWKGGEGASKEEGATKSGVGAQKANQAHASRS